MKRLSRLSASAAGITIAVLAIVVLAADQLSKYFAVDRLTEFESVEVVGEALQWRLVYNPGAAFSLGESVTWIFTIALAVVACIIVFLAITRSCWVCCSAVCSATSPTGSFGTQDSASAMSSTSS